MRKKHVLRTEQPGSAGAHEACRPPGPPVRRASCTLCHRDGAAAAQPGLTPNSPRFWLNLGLCALGRHGRSRLALPSEGDPQGAAAFDNWRRENKASETWQQAGTSPASAGETLGTTEPFGVFCLKRQLLESESASFWLSLNPAHTHLGSRQQPKNQQTPPQVRLQL